MRFRATIAAVSLAAITLAGSPAFAVHDVLCPQLSFTTTYAGDACCWNIFTNFTPDADGAPAVVSLDALAPSSILSATPAIGWSMIAPAPFPLFEHFDGLVPPGSSMVGTICIAPGEVIPQIVNATFEFQDGVCEPQPLFYDCPPEPNCRLDAGACIDECPPGEVCDPNCGGCIPEIKPCTRLAGGTCEDQCPVGEICDPLCQECVPDQQGPCTTDADGVCKDQCPDGMVCDPTCADCVPVDNPLCVLQPTTGICGDKCPDGMVCDPTCTDCIPIEPGPCSLDADGTCNDLCPDGFICDPNCSDCVPIENPRCKFDPAADVCVDNCPDGMICDPTCVDCVPVEPGPCNWAADGTCADKCPAGEICDPECNFCMPIENPTCKLDPATGICEDDCPAGEICDPECQGCIPIEVPQCQWGPNGQCKDNCPAGEICDPECNHCMPIEPMECQWTADGLCLDDCPPGYRCDDTCVDCMPVENGEICGHKFRDIDMDGEMDSGEPGIPGWQIVLVDASGAAVLATTDANGIYCFEDVVPGTYTLYEIAKPGWAQTGPSLGSYSVSLMPGQSVLGFDFGNECCNDVPADAMVNMNTGWSQGASATIPPANPDDDWKVRQVRCKKHKPISAFSWANVVRRYVWPAPFADTHWITPIVNPSDPTRAGTPPPADTCWEYQRCFCLNKHFKHPALDISFKADDQVDSIELNGDSIYSGPGANFNSPEDLLYTKKKHWKKGTNCVSFFVRDSHRVITGLDVAGSVSAENGQCCPSKKKPLEAVEVQILHDLNP